MALLRVIERDRRDVLGEGPLWSARDDAVYWTDILGHRINRLSLAGGAVESWRMPGYTGWVIERESGGFVAGIGREVAVLDPDGTIIDRIARIEPDRAGNRVNDAKADAAGRVWMGTMPITADKPTGGFYRLDPEGAVTLVDHGYSIANGPAIGADGQTILHTDSGLGIIYRFQLDAAGNPGERTEFIRFEPHWGKPDGMTFDAEGGLWVACWGGGCVMRFTPEGERDRIIELPASQISSCTFAGPNLDRMFVTSAAVDVDEPLGGALFEVDPGCRGLPTHRYRG
ncbi:SMP-30/gluconolactonase/LRE family protein [Sphingomonas sp.]|uniref:SMP-30/gluconolactonase/LRE family protein n=1 Tax=Sphingomonas sp. TaxID=28214 RepID=UPI002ED7E9B7